LIREQPTTIAIIGANPVVENALAHLLGGEGYSTTVLEPFSLTEGESLEEEMPSLLGGVDLVVLAPSLSATECEAFLAYRRASKQRTPSTPSAPPTDTPVVVLCTPMKDSPALLKEEDKAVTRSVAWPTTRERLVREVEAALLVLQQQQQEARLAAHREEQASAPEKKKKMEYAE
jgi:hypothetical protein